MVYSILRSISVFSWYLCWVVGWLAWHRRVVESELEFFLGVDVPTAQMVGLLCVVNVVHVEKKRKMVHERAAWAVCVQVVSG